MTPAAQVAERGMDGLNVKSLALGVTLGNLASQGIQRAIAGFANLGREALAAVGSYEMLALSTSALVAKELRAADATLSMEDALDQAGPRAEELLKWIEQLAIASPFSSEDVSSAFKLAQTYGFTSSQAQVLTTAILNFAAATGQSGAILQQLAYPLGQIARAGKVLTQDLRQLTTAGIDVTAILKSIGKSWDDVASGSIESNEFLQAFVATLNNDFAGAAARSSTTLQGLIASLGDLKTIGLRNLAAPAVKAFEEAFTPLIGKIQNGLLPALAVAGQYLGDFTRFLIANKEAILTTVGALTAGTAAFLLIANAGAIYTASMAAAAAVTAVLSGAITFLLSPIGILAVAVGGLAALFVASYSEIDSKTKSFFGGMGDDLFSFGEGIILSLANGMAAAIGAIVSVLTQIGAMIAHWLAPGSPPLLLPEIDEWGADAMNEYLRGFLAADFGIFNQLSSTIEGFFQSLGAGDDPNLIPTILRAREAIAAAVASMSGGGAVGEEALQGIFDSLGMVNPDLQEYIRLVFASAQASEALKRAQEALNDITARYSALLSPLRDELDAISQEQQRTARQDRRKELEGILEMARANGDSEAERRALMELRALDLQDQIALIEQEQETETEAAQATVDAAAEEARAAAERLAAQQALIAAQVENNRLIQRQIELLERLAEAGAAGGAGGAAGGGASGMPSLPLDLGNIPIPDEAPFSAALANLQKRFNDFVTQMKAPFLELSDNVDKMKEAWGAAFSGMGNVAITFFDGLQGRTTQSKSEIYQWTNQAGLNIHAFVQGLEGENIKATTSFQEFSNNTGLAIANFILGLTEMKATGGSEIETFANEAGLDLRRFTEDVVGGVLVVITKLGEGKENIKLALAAIGMAFTVAKDEIMERLGMIGKGIETFVTTGLENLTNLKDHAIELFQEMLDKIKPKLDEIVTAVTAKIDEIMVWIGGKVQSFRDLGSSLMDGMAEGVMSAIQGLVSAVTQGIQDALDAAAGLLDPGSPSRVTAATLGVPFAQGIGAGIAQAMPGVRRLVTAELGDLLSTAGAAMSLPATSSQVASQATTNNYYSSTTGIQNANINNGMDVAAVEAIALRVVNRAVSYA